ncbi:MAG: hypothetical protein M5U07_05925 [Xanthobacteraceae bacterium]|nr:hypothetical protein [Xanthobacteraceae bacterium]
MQMLNAVDFGIFSARPICDNENGCCGWLSSRVSTAMARSIAGTSDFNFSPDAAAGLAACLVL